MRLIALAAAVLLFAIATPLAAHGPESHEEEKTAQVSPPTGSQAPIDAVGDSSARAAQADVGARQEPQVTVASVLENLHPATVHFPIGLLFAAALVELLAWRRRSQRLAQAATVMVGAGAIGSVIAALFGWIHTGLWFGGDGLVQWHRWLGTNLAALALLAWWVSRYPDYRKAFRVLLFASATLIMVQGYLGAELSHGPNHLLGAHHEASPQENEAISPAPQAAGVEVSGETRPAVDPEGAESPGDTAEPSPAPSPRQTEADATRSSPAPAPSPTPPPAAEQADPHAGHDMDAPPTD